jgi:pyruvate,orthophosphate dikinase
MVPVTIGGEELKLTKIIVDRIHTEMEAKYGIKLEYLYGSMLEIPRACFMANKMAETAQFFSFGTNDLTQMTYGFSRDDASNFIPDYLANKIIEKDPFQTIDPNGVGELITIACERGRSVRPDIKVGICGEQGGDPKSVEQCEKNNLTHVSCSPFRVPIARLAAAQAAIKNSK